MPESSRDERHLTTDELAARLGLPKETIYGWRKRGLGPRALRIGRHLRFRLRDVEAWERSRERGGE